MSENSLLPPNSTPVERSLENSFCRHERIPIPIDQLWNPETCPINVLPWLAWALSVDLWDSDWTEERKRAFIANSLEVHRQKGTIASIRGVLSNLGITAEIREWFQPQLTPPFVTDPHTFSLTAWVSDPNGNSSTLIDAQTYRDLIRAIEHTKPVRSHFDFRVGVQFTTAVGKASAISFTILIRETVTPTRGVESSSRLSLPFSAAVIPYVRVN